MLTDAKVRSAKPRDKSYKLTDVNRLYLLMTPAGGKLWRWNSISTASKRQWRSGAIR